MASTRSKAQCAATEHRASEAQSGAKTRGDYAELRSCHITLSALAELRSYHRPSSFSGALAVRKPSPASSSMNSAIVQPFCSMPFAL